VTLGIQIGDFIAKAILYDHLTKNKGQDKEKVLDRISVEFVNYNRNAGRGRDYLESIGMLWFMNYKIRIMKIAIRTMRERPLTALMYAGGLGPLLNVDTVPSNCSRKKNLQKICEYTVKCIPLWKFLCYRRVNSWALA
jgi:hypothetical protein